jgi:dihydroorotate dehydrogenase electron transfer subunit
VKIATDDGSKGCKGPVTEPLKKLLAACKPETYLPDFRRIMIYACGPTGMLKAVRAIARERGIPCQVSLEERMACGVGVCLGCPVKVKSGGYRMVCKDGPVFNAEEVVL